ncbi:hypothetical protein [Kitasatospora sp. McL0602]|uniref:hypothetical protein n=1 Tax=Kitasatospora sp. McL0602 TaxID=3439530 RepID=UPI003F8BF694
MRCGVCGSERLGPLGELTSGNRPGDQRYLRLRFPRPKLLSARPQYDAYYARACRDCGAVIPFLGPAVLKRFAAEAEGLEGLEGEEGG